ncbi:MAG: response regulator [Anaerolineae bacterium]
MVDNPTTKKRILIIEGNPDELRLIEYLLNRPEFELAAAATAATGARLLRNGLLPDLLILDLTLPDISGIELLKQMRNRPQFDGIPVIVLADATRPMEIRTALVAGADRYVTKTYMGNNLLKTVFEVLQTGRMAAADA